MQVVEKARIGHAPEMQELINYFASMDEMLARSLSEISENIRDYFIVGQDERVIACAALHVSWSDLAEIKSLAVSEDSQKQGIGTQLVKACLREAEELGIATAFVLTNKPAFFKKLGFSQLDKAELPSRIWTECYRCPKFETCDEIALIYKLKLPASS